MHSIQYQRIEQVALSNNFSSAAALFKKIGISRTTLYLIRDDKQELSRKVALRIVNLCKDTSVDWLLTGVEREVSKKEIIRECESCKEKDRVIEDLRFMSDLLKEKNRFLTEELAKLKDYVEAGEKKTA